MKKLSLSVVVMLLALSVTGYTQEAKWWKGNTHTHSWWSDGNCPPEIVVQQFKEKGYNFLSMTEHDILPEGIKWYPVKEDTQKKALDLYKEKFGADWVETRQGKENLEVRLKTLTEYRSLFEKSGEFILIKGQEISDSYDKRPVHLNAINLETLIPQHHGDSAEGTLRRDMQAIVKQSEITGNQILGQANHPIWERGLHHTDLAYVREVKFFEIFNSESAIGDDGDLAHPDTDQLWDMALAIRLTEISTTPLYGIASDDSHDYFNKGTECAAPGLGWIMVRAKRLTPDSLISAMDKGDFYSSTGVILKDVKRDNRTLAVEVDAKEGIHYKIQFIGSKKDRKKIGVLYKEIEGTNGNHTLQDDDLYVRAKIVSDHPHPYPYCKGDLEVAWTQPLVIENIQIPK